MMQAGVEIVPYDQQWSEAFQAIKLVITKALPELIIEIEHVGSTSIHGLGAKPILDIDIVIASDDFLPEVIKGLEKIGYFHQEEWSFEGREAFGRKDIFTPWNETDTHWMQHHLYVCNQDSIELANHLVFRDYLRNNPEALTEYESVKTNLTRTVSDRKSYTLGKTEFINRILEKAMM